MTVEHRSKGAPVAGTADLALLLRRDIDSRTGHRTQDLLVSSLDGSLLVEGRVKSFYLKQLVIAAVMSFSQAHDVDARIDLDVSS